MINKRAIPPASDEPQLKNDYCALNRLEYFRPNIIRLDLPFILTENKMLVLGMPYLKMEGQHIDAVKLLDVWDSDGYVYLKIKHINSEKKCTLSWSLEYNGQFWLWSLSSITFIENRTNNNCNGI